MKHHDDPCKTREHHDKDRRDRYKREDYQDTESPVYLTVTVIVGNGHGIGYI